MYNHDWEQLLIGAILQDPDLQKELPTIPLDLMHESTNELILATLQDMQQKHLPIEVPTIVAELTGKVDGGYILKCYRACATVVNVRHYMSKLQEMAARRRAYRAASEFCGRLTAGDDVAGSIDELRTQLRNLEATKGSLVRMSELAQMIYADVESRSKGERKSLSTGIPDLDACIGGLEETDLMVIGARPGNGKSALGVQIGLNVGARRGRVLVCSREMSEIQYGHRIASNLADINGQRLKQGKLDAEEWPALAEACNEMAGYPISFAFNSATVEELRVLAQREKDIKGLDLIVVDYLQIMDTSMKKAKRYEEVGAISRALKAITLDLRVPVIAMAQVGRPSEKKAVMPGLSELRESGNIEQDADIVVFLHHPDEDGDASIPQADIYGWKSIESLPGHQYIVVNIAKQRQGVCRKFGIDFDAAHMKYTCIQH